MLNKIIQGNCFDLMKAIPNNTVDFVFCDLPYGVTGCSWDSEIDLVKLWKEYERICKENATICLSGVQPFTTTLINSKKDWFKYCWVWDKHIPRGFQTAKYRPMSRHEDIVVFTVSGGKHRAYNPQMVERDKPVKVKNYKKKSNRKSSHDIGKYNDESKHFVYTHRNPDTIIQGCWEANRGKIHPTQKPVSLIEYLINTYTNEGDIVLDNCAGSASTAIAAVNTKRNFYSFELDIEFYNKSLERFQNLFQSKV